MNRIAGFLLIILLLGLSGAFSFAHALQQGPADSTGRVLRTPPTHEELQRMIEERNENPACGHRSSAWLSRMSEPLSPMVAYYPTANMYDYDVLHYRIDIEIDMATEWIGGYVEIRIESLVDGLATIDLTFTTDMVVTNVRLDGVAQSFSHTTEILTTNLSGSFDTGEQFTLKVEYNGYPQAYNGGMFWDYYAGRKVCNTSCEPFGSRNWWPCKDFPFDKCDSADIVMTYPTTFGGYPMECVSAGILVSDTDNGDGTKTTHWFEKYPIAEYLVAIVLTEFDQISESWEYAPGEFMPVEHNYFPTLPPGNPAYSTYWMLDATIPALDAYSYYFGRYPFYDEKYGNMHCTFPGMEHQTMSSIGTYWSSEYVIIHELAHQWAGDQVTCSPFNHMWINEGFGTYFEVIYYEYHYGWEFAHNYLMGIRTPNAGSPYVEDLENDNVFDPTTVYRKGAWVTHMLRRQMGDSLFFPAMQYFYFDSEFAGGSASTDDLNSVVSDFYGSDMNWFFDAWVYQFGQPNYEYFYGYEPDTAVGEGYLVRFFIEQDNDDGIFPMNLEIEAFAGDFDTLYRVWNGNQSDIYEFHLPEIPDSFIIDPDDKILKTVRETTSSMHIISGNPPDAIVGQPYSFTFQAMWGVPEYYWEKILGQFPYGMTLNEETGELSGTPSSVADHFFRLECTDSDSPPVVDQRDFIISVVNAIQRGDCDGSGGIDIDDVVFLINYVFTGGPAPDPIEIGDVNCESGIDIDDIVYLIAYIFTGGPAPCEP